MAVDIKTYDGDIVMARITVVKGEKGTREKKSRTETEINRTTATVYAPVGFYHGAGMSGNGKDWRPLCHCSRDRSCHSRVRNDAVRTDPKETTKGLIGDELLRVLTGVSNGSTRIFFEVSDA
ncbi:Hypothetical protein CINCED_3A015550 [Cinara cedri]|uniref:Uncharacterized protein n=1 Tax=Cinara cedri TaxID=506608 RepID=A0A5E4N8I3_9HEMI|nr:Hypothetical protein CINCED_3A015550 [Cinara cedri]